MFYSMKFNIYMISLIFGTFLASSSSSWFSCWLGLEINLMSLIPLLIIQLNPYSSETAIKYFIAQALASLIIIFSSISMLQFNSINSTIMINLMILLSLAIKMGAAPFHFWLPQVIQTSKWFQILIVLTWQKIAPMILISFVKNNFMKMLIFFSCLIGAAGAINQTFIKKILVYSSILHTGWLLSSLICSENIWFIYFVVYSLISSSLILSFVSSPLNSSKEIFFSGFSPFLTFFIFLNFLSMAGIPPFLGFAIKLMTISSMFLMNFDFVIMSILIFSSLISLFYYMRLIFSSMILSLKNNKLMFYESFKSSMNLFLLTLSSLSLIFSTWLFIFF